MLRTRIYTALVLFPILVVIVLTSDSLYRIGVVLVLGIGAWELYRLAQRQQYTPSLAAAWFTLAVILLSTIRPDTLWPGVTLGIFLTMGIMLWNYRQGDAAPFNSFALTMGIGLYLGWLGAHLLLLRELPAGEWWTLTVLLCDFAADTGAYFIGTRFGQHRLAPKISPRKSWEGYLGGVGTAVLFGAGVVLLWPPAAQIQPLHGAVIGLLVALISPLGDLAVSAFKRQAGVKDTSQLIPGHGGMMDRLDTVLIAAVLGYYYILWFT